MKGRAWSIPKIVFKIAGIIITCYITFVFASLLVSPETFLRFTGYDSEKVDWCYQFPGKYWYIVEIDDNSEINIVKAKPVSRFLPSHVVAISDKIVYRLDEGKCETISGWTDATITSQPGQSLNIIANELGLVDGVFCNLLITIDISCATRTEEQAYVFSKTLTTPHGKSVSVSINVEEIFN